jgi:hypothetical protein
LFEETKKDMDNFIKEGKKVWRFQTIW